MRVLAQFKDTERRELERQLQTGKTMQEIFPERRDTEGKVIAPGFVEVDRRYVEPWMLYDMPGRDMNGGLLMADARALLDEHGYDAGQRDYFWYCWREMERERRTASRERDEQLERERAAR